MASAPPLEEEVLILPSRSIIQPVIALARDKAFCFYYQENLELLEKLGGKLVYFSPLEDEGPPEEADALYLGGGYPELYARQLSQNQACREAVKQAASRGMPVLAECGGFLYLQKSLQDEEGSSWPMAGVLPGEGFPTGKLGRFGYVEVTSWRTGLMGQHPARGGCFCKKAPFDPLLGVCAYRPHPVGRIPPSVFLQQSGLCRPVCGGGRRISKAKKG